MSPVQKQSTGGGHRRGQEAGSAGSSAQHRLHRHGRRHHHRLRLNLSASGTATDAGGTQREKRFSFTSMFVMFVKMTHRNTQHVVRGVLRSALNKWYIYYIAYKYAKKNHIKLMYGVKDV